MNSSEKENFKNIAYLLSDNLNILRKTTTTRKSLKEMHDVTLDLDEMYFYKSLLSFKFI